MDSQQLMVLQLWSLAGGLTSPHHKRQACYKISVEPQTCEHSLEPPKQWKMDMTFGTWNVSGIWKWKQEN